MKRNKFYIFLIILTIISLFSFAALCNQCAVDTGDKVDVEEDETVVDEDDADTDDDIDTDNEDDTDMDDDTDASDDDDTDTDDADTEKEAPTMTLEIYEGPMYSAADDICYWRVKANVDGSPNPTISWSRDNSNGSFGTKKAQVNLNRGETYTLIAIATNSEGSVEKSIVLEWGCDEPEPEPEIITGDMDITASNSGSGYIAQGFGATMGTNEVFIGDTNVDTVTKGYLSFNISDLSDMDDITFTDVDLRIPIDEVGGEPWLGADIINIKVFYYGSNLDVPEDFEIGGELVKTFNINDSLDNLSFGNNTLKSELQDAVDSGKSRFQFKLGFNNKSNNGMGDWYLLNPDNVTLSVEYEVAE